MNKCYSDGSCESDHAGPGEILHSIKGFDLSQGLFCLLDGHWSKAFDKNLHSSRHGLDDLYGYEYVCIESSSISELQPFSRHTGKSADPDWKWIFHQQQASMSDLLTPAKSMDSFANTVVADLEPSLQGDVKKATAELSFASVLSVASKAYELPYAHPGIPKPCRIRMLKPSDTKEAMPTMNPALSWHVKDVATTIPQRCQLYTEDHSGQFVAAVSSGSHALAEKHDLLASASSLPWMEVGVTEDFGVFHEAGAERKLSANVMPVWKGALDSTTPVCELLTGYGERYIIPTTLQEFSVQDRSLYCVEGDEMAAWKASNETCSHVKKHDADILGEALCRAQTRARLAEKLAAQALQEREWLAHMLLREALTTCTYKQRAQALELENRLLKLRPHVGIETWTGRKSVHPLTRRRASTSQRRKLEQTLRLDTKNSRDLCIRQSKESISSTSWKERVLLSCTLGLAFVLGLSIAGIGLMIGWSIGWMMFP